MLKEVFYFLKGYVIIKVEGKFPERFLNVAGRKNLLLWDLKPKQNAITFKIAASELRQAKESAENCGLKLSVLGKIGLPFTAKRHKSRKALLFGLVGFAAIVIVLFSLLWDISITGNESIPTDTVLKLLAESGIKRGVSARGIDPRQACNEISAKCGDIAWIGIEIKGTCAKVEIVEKVKKPVIEDKSIPCNIVSDKSGVVEKMQIRSGVPAVNVGDAVFDGQLLVSGIADSPILGVRYLHADGDIYLRVWHEADVKKPLSETKRVPTGNVQKRYVVNLFGYKIPLYLPKNACKFAAFDKTDTQGTFIETHTYTEITEKKEKITLEKALADAEKEFRHESERSGEVLNITKTYKESKDFVSIHFTAEVLEKTGEKREIERDTNGENPTG